MAVGVATGAYREAVKYARQREQFGQPIIRFKCWQHMLADMWYEDRGRPAHWTYRAGLYAVADHPESGAFLGDGQVSRVGGRHAGDHGRVVQESSAGNGYSKEYPGREDVPGRQDPAIYEGTNQLLRSQIADHIVKPLHHWG